MKVVISSVVDLEDSLSESLSNGDGTVLEEFLGGLSEYISSRKEVSRCFGFSVSNGSDSSVSFDNFTENNDSLVKFLDHTEVDNSFKFDSLLGFCKVFVIRIPVEGCESIEERFRKMDEVILRARSKGDNSNGILEEEHPEVYFLFDSGSKSDYYRRATSYLFNKDNRVKEDARNNGVSFCQWLPKTTREMLLTCLD